MLILLQEWMQSLKHLLYRHLVVLIASNVDFTTEMDAVS